MLTRKLSILPAACALHQWCLSANFYVVSQDLQLRQLEVMAEVDLSFCSQLCIRQLTVFPAQCFQLHKVGSCTWDLEETTVW